MRSGRQVRRCASELLCVLALALPAVSCAAAAADPARANGAVDQVVALYRSIAWQAVLQQPADAGPGLMAQPAAVLGRWFDPTLARLLVDDHACRHRTRQICALDFDPLWDSQDPLGATVAITPGLRLGEVQVQLAYGTGTSRAPLVFQLTAGPSGWRIADIRYPAGQAVAASVAAGQALSATSARAGPARDCPDAGKYIAANIITAPSVEIPVGGRSGERLCGARTGPALFARCLPGGAGRL